ncbi:hypothetical protein LguiA_015943 [Lonicera macranthoides]
MFSCMRGTSFITQRQCLDRKLLFTSSTLDPLQLPAQRETHFWYVFPSEVKSESLLNQYLELLSPCEKENVLSLREGKLRKGALLARALVRTTIARYLINSQVTPRSLKFKKNIHGKPEVEWQHDDDLQPVPLHFNISHTSSLVACGVTAGYPIGIDVEEKQRQIKNNVLSFARRYFTHHEVEVLTSILDPEVRHQEFIKLWTLKEAYVKALGRGFSGSPFNTFTIRLKPTTRGSSHLHENSNSEASEIVVEPLDDPVNSTSNWQFALLELAGSHYAAICRENDSNSEGRGNERMELRVWKTIPCVEEEYVSGTDAVVAIGGLA